MPSISASLIYDRHYAGFSVRYYLTTETLHVGDSAETESQPCYGVLLEKIGEGNTNLDTEGAVLSESRDGALRALQLLHDMEVTPMSLYEVIDLAMERTELV